MTTPATIQDQDDQRAEVVVTFAMIDAAPEMLAVLRFVSTDPCFSILGTVTQDEVRAIIERAEKHS